MREVSRLFLRRWLVFRHLRRREYFSVPIVFIRFLFAKVRGKTGVWQPRAAPHASNEDRILKNSAGVAIRRAQRLATVGVKCRVLCVSSQSGLLAMAERMMGTSAACRIKCRLDRTSASLG